MSGRHKANIAVILTGAVLGSLFMLAVLGYFPGRERADAKPGAASSGDSPVSLNDTLSRPVFGSRHERMEAAQEEIAVSRRNAIVRAAEKVGQAVVSLSVIQVVKTRNPSPFGSDFWDFFFLPPPARERRVLSLGSGVIINSQGYVLTNDHVVDGAKEIRVTLMDGEEYQGKLIGADPVTDLAVVKIIADSVTFPNAVLGNSDDLIIGEWAIAIGNPFGYLLDDPKPTVTVGVISAINRDIKPERGQKAVYRNMIQTDAAINPGNSGGPLVNALGEVIGINTFIFTSSRGSEGIGFAVPINRAKIVIDEILKHGEVVNAWIGVQVQTITPGIAASLGLKRRSGLIVSSVSERSPARKAGLKPGDVLISVGDDKMEDVADWEEIANYARAGRKLDMRILRGTKEITLSVVPEKEPTLVAPKEVDKFGLEVVEITPEVASYMGVRNRQGVMVLGAREDSWAYNWGLRKGDIIRQIGRHRISDLKDYIDTVASIGRGYRIVFMIERKGDIFFIRAYT